MTDLPDDLRDRAARAAWEVWTEEPCEMAMSTWCRVVDAVAEVLAGHLKKHCLSCNSEVDPLDQMLEIDYSSPTQRMAIELVELRAAISRLKRECQSRKKFVVGLGMTPAHASMSCELIEEFLSGPAGAAHTEETS